ncbi:MAG: TIR domain-containing protein [Planctomycetes bacterium]|nr:TIR domain-containing protein [Planctomycetota bacterium]
MDQSQTPLVYLSHSSANKRWLENLLRHLGPLEEKGVLQLWHDERIEPGAEWAREVQDAIRRCNIAVLFISPDYLASEFILHSELPELLHRADDDPSFRVLPVLVEPCDWDSVTGLASRQFLPRGLEALSDLKSDKPLIEIAAQIRHWAMEIRDERGSSSGEVPKLEKPESAELSAEPIVEERPPSISYGADSVPYHADAPAIHDELGRRYTARVLWRLIREILSLRQAGGASGGKDAEDRNARNEIGGTGMSGSGSGGPGTDGSGNDDSGICDSTQLASQEKDGEPRLHHDSAFLVHLHGPWGAGKTSLLNLLKDEMESDAPAEQWISIDFNAWQHERVDTPWWSLMSEIRSQGTAAQEGWRKRWQTQWQHWFWLASGIISPLLLALGVLLVSGLGVCAVWLFSASMAKSASDTARIVSSLVGLGFTFWGIARAFSNRVLPTTAMSARRYVEVSQDPLKPLVDRFDRLVRGFGRPVAVFIDDLDRCSALYVVELLQVVQNLFGQTAVVYVVAADRKWLWSSYEQVYSEFVEKIGQPGRPLGHLFMEKVFQLSVALPVLSPEFHERYWGSLIGGSEGDATETTQEQLKESRSAFDSLSEKEVLDRLGEKSSDADRQAALERLDEPEVRAESQHFLTGFAHLVSRNPREMKRLLNLYRFQRDFRVLAGQRIDREITVLWAIVELRWPLLADHLSKKPADIGIARGDQECPDAGISDDIAALLQDDSVKDVCSQAKLDEDAIRKCIGLVE